MCLSNRKKTRFLPTTTRTAYKVISVGKDGALFSPYREYPLKVGKWLKAVTPDIHGFCVFQHKLDAIIADADVDDQVFTVRVRKIVASGTFGSARCWAAAEMLIPVQTNNDDDDENYYAFDEAE